jgi:pantetheine-phosphate adenylyltransferase
MSQRAIYPGTFDPVTFGHIDLIKRACSIFSEVTIAVAHNPHKEPLFTVKERMQFLKKAISGMSGVVIDDFDGLVVDYAHKKGISILIRGLRMISDFEYEFQMALTNRKLAPDIETIFLMPKEDYSYLSSKLLKETVNLGADISCFVPDFVYQALRKKVASNK